jgi:hypothetical protein
MYIALEGPMAFVDILNYALVGQGLIGLNMAAYATTIAYTSLLNITDDIKKFIIEHQTYISKDILDTVGVVGGCYFMLEGGSFVATGFSLVFCIIAEGDLILNIRDHYLPREYWKYISLHRGPIYGYKLETYIGADNCIHYKEIPKNPDGTLRENETIYI